LERVFENITLNGIDCNVYNITILFNRGRERVVARVKVKERAQRARATEKRESACSLCE